MTVDSNNIQDLKIKTLSMLFWMMMEPNIFSVVKLPGGDNFLYMDIYSLYDHAYIQGGIDGSFDSVSNYEEYDDKFTEIFTHSDIMHFLGFHNHEYDGRFDSIIDYIKQKVMNFFIYTLKELDKESELFDLRK